MVESRLEIRTPAAVPAVGPRGRGARTHDRLIRSPPLEITSVRDHLPLLGTPFGTHGRGPLPVLICRELWLLRVW